MKSTKILPAAAGVIALTAAVGFARDLKGGEEYDFVRLRIMERSDDAERMTERSVRNGSQTVAIDSETGQVYLVKVGYGGDIHEVEIDARNGKVVCRRTIRQMKV